MSAYELTPEAVGDLQEIWIYIARDNVSAADRLEADFYEAFDKLANNPGLGHKRPDLTDEAVLFLPVRGHYLVIYQRRAKPLKIVRILHGARDAQSQL